MSRSAHRRIGTAHPLATALALALALALAGLAQAQAVVVPAPLPNLDALALDALARDTPGSDGGGAQDPLTRGEAALWLASSGRVDAYRAILTVAREAAPQARLRGILAVGLLGAPGAVSFLSAVLDGARTSDPEAAVAAFGLGRQPGSVPTPSVDAWLGGVHGSSYRRMRDPLAALLAGLAILPHPEKVTALSMLLTDAANREDVLLALATRALVAAGAPLDRSATWARVEDRSDLLRCEALAALTAAGPVERDAIDLLRRVARTDTSPRARGLALGLLAQALDDEAFELAPRALASAHVDEAVAGARVLVRLAGDVGRDAVELRIATPSAPAAVRAALLATWDRGLTPRLTFTCRDIADSPTSPAELRVAAAIALKTAQVERADTLLAAAFELATGREHLTRLCAAMSSTQLADVRRDLEAAAAPRARHFTDRIHALARTSFDAAAAVVLTHARAHRLGDRQRGDVLAALRTARGSELADDVLSLLPPVLVALLE